MHRGTTILMLLLAFVLVACNTTDKVLDQNDPRALIRATGGEAGTDPINIQPKTMLAMPGATGNDLEDYSVGVEHRTHTPTAGDVFSAALTGGQNQGLTARDSATLKEYRLRVEVTRKAYLAALNGEATGLAAANLQTIKSHYDDALTALAAYEEKLVERAKTFTENASEAFAGLQEYTYSPVKVVIAGNETQDVTGEKALEKIAEIVAAKKGELFGDEAADEEVDPE